MGRPLPAVLGSIEFILRLTQRTSKSAVEAKRPMTVLLCGDVMIGRGIDQVLPHPSAPVLYEAFAQSAGDYVRLAEQANGVIRKPVPFEYVWGDALGILTRERADVRIVNLETAVTRVDQPWPKGINYRMNPDNLPCLAVANIDCCVLANNHVLDWGRKGLIETLDELGRAGLKTAGAGSTDATAAAPAVLSTTGKGRVLVYAVACASSGVPDDWAARRNRSGVNFVAKPSATAVEAIAKQIRGDRRPGDVIVLSVHWEANWGYEIDSADRAFAHQLIDLADVDVIYGHSSHHAKAIEVYRDKPILYGCGDLLNDYEGIETHKVFRGDLVLAYIGTFDSANRHLIELKMAPFRIRNFRLNYAAAPEARWLQHTMDRECRRFGGRVALGSDGLLSLSWQ